MSLSHDGLLVLNKPSGCTSFDCVAMVRRRWNVKRVGHCGTLDPMAEGVLLILLGTSTRHQDSFLGLEKQYRFRARWHISTDTGDREGQEVKQFERKMISTDQLNQVLETFVGEQQQVPPRYAALKYKGRRYYDWARSGVEIPRQSRSIRVESFQLLQQDAQEWEARVSCSRGTYVRTLAEDVAARLDTGCHLVELVRERVGPFQRVNAMNWSTLQSAPLEELQQHVQDPVSHHARLV